MVPARGLQHLHMPAKSCEADGRQISSMSVWAVKLHFFLIDEWPFFDLKF